MRGLVSRDITMTRDELLERLNGFEWNDVEFKEAAREVPKDAWSTVSAFSNTAGGSLVFGVRRKDGMHEIVGVIKSDKVQSDFLSRPARRAEVEPSNFGD